MSISSPPTYPSRFSQDITSVLRLNLTTLVSTSKTEKPMRPVVPISPQSKILYISVPFNISAQRPSIIICSLLYFLPLKSAHEKLSEHLSDGSGSNSSRAAIFKGQTCEIVSGETNSGWWNWVTIGTLKKTKIQPRRKQQRTWPIVRILFYKISVSDTYSHTCILYRRTYMYAWVIYIGLWQNTLVVIKKKSLEDTFGATVGHLDLSFTICPATT